MSAKRHYLRWLAFLTLIVVIAGLQNLQQTWGQEEEKAAAGADAEGAAGAPAEGGGVEGAKAPQRKSAFVWFIQSSGLIGFFILCLSIYFVATVIRLFMELRKGELLPKEELAICDQYVAERNYQALYDFTSKSPSLYSRLVTAGIAALNGGDLAEAREVMDRHGEVATVDMERQVAPLAVLGTLGPMIGLVGTLKGMITSFAAIAMYDTQLRASQVAGGISEALLLTFEGVALSVPAIYFFSFFRNRVAVYSAEALLASDELVRRVVQQAKSKSSTPPIPTAART
ncbi:MAG TPA: MotA/TolQ/ExbB proton channel family protein [Pirellulaceae bacterium]|nr:MotA/TolQ/ExbB proton channel family protein [Pirellulaceae bacterium]